MRDAERRIVVDMGLDATVAEVNRAIDESGMLTMAVINVRDHFWLELQHDFRGYVVIQAWSPELALDALQHDLDAATVAFTTFALYELADGETAVAACAPYSPNADEPGWRLEWPALALVADRERLRVAGVLDRLQRPALKAAVR